MNPASRLRPPTEWQRRLVMPRLTRPDVWLLAAVAGLLGLGIVMVFNVSYFHAAGTLRRPATSSSASISSRSPSASR